MMRRNIGFREALDLVLEHVPTCGSEEEQLIGLSGRVLAEDVLARVDSPLLDVSLKDGYAVRSEDVAVAGPDRPVALELIRCQVAGDLPGGKLAAGQAVRVTTGAPLPPGAEAVLAGEFARERNGVVTCHRDAGPGRNVLAGGTDVKAGQVVARRGERLHPASIGLLAAAGLDRVRVTGLPRVQVIGTGDEVVFPGRPLPPGKLYASNIVETAAWLNHFGLTACRVSTVPDRLETIRAAVEEDFENTDVFLSSGGAWSSERDLVVKLLDSLGWTGIFHRVRLGPGKAAGFGLLQGRPFFILPGGPPSHEAAFLLLALPGLLAMTGRRGPVFPRLPARLAEDVEGQADWTQVVHAKVEAGPDGLVARPVKAASRLSSMAGKNALFLLPEGNIRLAAGCVVEVEFLGRRTELDSPLSPL
ncbi:MAG: molybdopterin molybdotransferase MoeA [Proteobacteria bacterium]|nr:molybdopterin molybdotransferase MoeA [Pseudomonadota bacterium]